MGACVTLGDAQGWNVSAFQAGWKNNGGEWGACVTLGDAQGWTVRAGCEIRNDGGCGREGAVKSFTMPPVGERQAVKCVTTYTIVYTGTHTFRKKRIHSAPVFEQNSTKLDKTMHEMPYPSYQTAPRCPQTRVFDPARAGLTPSPGPKYARGRFAVYYSIYPAPPSPRLRPAFAPPSPHLRPTFAPPSPHLRQGFGGQARGSRSRRPSAFATSLRRTSPVVDRKRTVVNGMTTTAGQASRATGCGRPIRIPQFAFRNRKGVRSLNGKGS